MRRQEGSLLELFDDMGVMRCDKMMGWKWQVPDQSSLEINPRLTPGFCG